MHYFSHLFDKVL